MPSRRNNGMRPFLVTLLLALTLPLPLAAQVPSNELGLSFGRAGLGTYAAVETTVDTIGTSFNHYWTPAISTRFSVTEFGVQAFNADLGAGRTFDMNALSIAGEYHVMRDNILSPYAGVGVAYVESEIHQIHSGSLSAGRELAPLVTVGADLNFARRFALAFDGTYILYRPDYEGFGRTDLDPFTISMAFKLRW
jgi:outer membrane protein W